MSPPPVDRVTRVLLLRHAETSAPHLFHGAESDVGLGEEGHRQAERVAGFLAGLAPAAVYCSAMRRACETAAPIARACGFEAPIRVAALHERRMGTLSGVEIEAHRERIAADRRLWQAGDLHAAHEGGESYLQIRDRVVGPFEALARAHPGQTIVVVAHGMVIRVLLTALVDGYTLDHFDRVAIRHVAVNRLRFEHATGRWFAEELDVDAG